MDNTEQNERPSPELCAEVSAYREHFVNVLQDFPDIASRYPAMVQAPSNDNEDPTKSFFDSLRDGVLIGCLVNHLQQGTIDMKRLAVGLDLSTINQDGSSALFKVNSNLDAVLAGARKLSGKRKLIIENIGPEDLLYMRRRELVCGLIWQMIRAHLMEDVCVAARPELVRLLEGSNDTVADLLAMPTEKLLLRWANYHLERAEIEGVGPIANFGGDLRNGKALSVLLSQVTPPESMSTVLDNAKELRGSILQRDVPTRIAALLAHAGHLHSRRFASASSISQGIARLNMAFVATLFNKHVGIVLPTETAIANRIERSVESLRSDMSGAHSVELRKAEKQLKLSEVAAKALQKQVADLEMELQKARQQIEQLSTEKEELIAQHDETICSMKQRENALNSIVDELRDAMDSNAVKLGDIAGSSITSVEEFPKVFAAVIENSKQIDQRRAVAEERLAQSNKVNDLISEKVAYIAELECRNKEHQNHGGGVGGIAKRITGRTSRS